MPLRPCTLAAIAFLATAPAISPALARDGLLLVGTPDVSAIPPALAGSPAATETMPAKQAVARFCDGIGERAPDLLALTAPLSAAQIAMCGKNGVTVTEVLALHQALVLLRGVKSEPLAVTRGQLWRALAAKVPADGHFVANTAARWSDLDPLLLANPIKIVGPAAGSARRQFLVDLALKPACNSEPAAENLAAAERAQMCGALRSGAALTDTDETDDALATRIPNLGDTIAVAGFTAFQAHRDDVDAVPIDGVEADAGSIGRGEYPLARAVYVYAKREHVGIVAGLKPFLAALTGPDALAAGGRGAALDVVPLEQPAIDAARQQALSLPKLGAQGS